MEYFEKYPRKNAQSASRLIDDEAVVVLPMESSISTLNSVGTRIWELADGTRTICEIATEIQNEFDVEKEIALNDTVDFIKELSDKKMISFNDSKEAGTDEYDE